jgi:hypothetical protein
MNVPRHSIQTARGKARNWSRSRAWGAGGSWASRNEAGSVEPEAGAADGVEEEELIKQKTR